MSGKSKRSNEVLSFQSDATELENQQLPFSARIVLYTILSLLGIAILWACLFKVDEIVVASGKFIASTNNIVMKPLERVVIKSIDVEVGQHVKAGQPLITFDETFDQAKVEHLTENLDSLTSEFNRLRAEFNEEDYAKLANPDNKNDKWQLAIFLKRTRYYKEKLEYYNQNAKRLSSSQETIRQSLSKQQERLESLQNLEKMFGGLYEKQVASLKELVEIKISRLQIEGDIDTQRNKLVEIEHELLSSNAERNTFIEEWNKTIAEEMVKTKRSLNETKEEYEKAMRLKALVCLRAPCDAIVLEIAQFSRGSAVREAEELITLVPLDSKIEAQVNILPQDIGRLKLGDDARIKLDAFPFQQHGVLDGKLRLISGDTFQETLPGSMVKQTYYHARIVVTGKLKDVPSNFTIMPGLQITAEIKVGKRRIINYLLNPLVKSLDEAIHEP